MCAKERNILYLIKRDITQLCKVLHNYLRGSDYTGRPREELIKIFAVSIYRLCRTRCFMIRLAAITRSVPNRTRLPIHFFLMSRVGKKSRDLSAINFSAARNEQTLEESAYACNSRLEDQRVISRKLRRQSAGSYEINCCQHLRSRAREREK